MASGAGTVDLPLPTLRREGISKLPYEAEYEKAALIQESTVGQELQGIHKQISEFDELLDQLGAKLEAFLVPDHPRPAPDEVVASPRDNKSAFRIEVHVIQNRMRTQLNRLSNLVVRIDQ